MYLLRTLSSGAQLPLALGALVSWLCTSVDPVHQVGSIRLCPRLTAVLLAYLDHILAFEPLQMLWARYITCLVLFRSIFAHHL